MLKRFWNHLGVTRKFTLTFSVIFCFILLFSLLSYMLLSIAHRKTVSDIEKSFNIQKLVFEMDRDLEKVRRIKHEFSLQNIRTHPFVFDDDFTDRIYRQLTGIAKHSQSLKMLISQSNVSQALQQRHINMNLYYSIANRCHTVFQELVVLVEQLVADQTGLQHQLINIARALQSQIEISGKADLLHEFDRMQINTKDYLFTRQRPFMQSALNNAFLLNKKIQENPHDAATDLPATLADYVSIAKAIADMDVRIQTKSNDFDLNTETLEPISADLISLANHEVEISQRKNQVTVRMIGILLFIAAVCGFVLVGLFAVIIHRTITRNIVRLTRQASRLQAGNLDVQERLENDDELGRLSESFNQMSVRMKTLIDGLEEQVEQRTQALLASNVSLKAEMVERQIAEKAKNKLEADLRQAHKMEAIGTLAGGIAHDFNNILGIIMGNTELAMDDISPANPARQNLEEILTATVRARDIVRQLLSFSRKTEQKKQIVSLPTLVKETIALLRATLPSTIEIRPKILTASGAVNADPSQIHQVLINLCTNAAHAMEAAGGELEIGVSETEIDEVTNLQFKRLETGRYLQLTVSDTGIGMPAEIIDKIFDPYFTTREMGKGTGMGLSIVHGIIKNHDGAVSVYSEPGKGSIFKILLPAAESAFCADAMPSDIVQGGDETILFVDDEKSIVEVGRSILERLGYQVNIQTDPEAALNAFCADPDKHDLVITDMTMPRMTGDELARRLLAIRPDTPVILCTGFSHKINKSRAKILGIRNYVEKPLNRYELATTVRAVLDGR